MVLHKSLCEAPDVQKGAATIRSVINIRGTGPKSAAP